MDIIKRKGGKELNLTILIFLILMGVIGFMGVDSYFNNLYSQYPVVNYETQVKDRMTKIVLEHGALLIDLSTGRKVAIIPSNFKNYDLDNYSLIEKGDSVIKKANSDSITIKNNGLYYVFVLKKTTNVGETLK
jgi:hypothetical protein